MALRLAEVEPRNYVFICNPTGDELAEMLQWWKTLSLMLGAPLIEVANGTLDGWIEHFGALPNWRQRWCTRLLKIEPTLAYLKAHQPATLYVGLRADEEERPGIYSNDVKCDFPLRRWGWGLQQVLSYLDMRQVRIPKRTACARCFGQRLSEWKTLLREHPEIYFDAERQEAKTGATFRSPGRDSQPASLTQLRAVFDRGKIFRSDQFEMFEQGACRVCSL